MGTMTQALKKALRETELSHKEIERRTGVPRGSIARFLKGTQSLRLDKADDLAKLFGIEAVARKEGK
jgi:transcriptional regulator with XRE-family HTH domain